MASRYTPPPIIKAIERLLVDIEQAVGTFARKHREIGKSLREQAMLVFHLANKACRDRARQAHWVYELVWAIDDLRQILQTCKLLGVTRSLRQFEHLVRQIESVGMQSGGWHRQLSSKAQNARGDEACAQRGQKLSTRAAPFRGANP
jgi:hypothetical protein